MLCQSQEVARHHTTLRWKEWIPLLSQQLRLRNLVQIIAYNIHCEDKCTHVVSETTTNKHGSHGYGRITKGNNSETKTSFYYTLHLTTMSAPFYTSEKLENENAKWNEIGISSFMNHLNSAVNGIVVRLWSHRGTEQDRVITVWGVYFSGLVYLGPLPCADPTLLGVNTIVFHMQGGYFTAAQCIKQIPCKTRITKVILNNSDVKPSYNVNSLLSLHSKQQVIKKQMLACQDLRQKISVGGLTPKPNENAVLRRLLNESRPKVPPRQDIMKAKKDVELLKFQVKMLTAEKNRKQTRVQQLLKTKDILVERNQDRGSELMSRYQNLHKDMEYLKEWRKTYVEMREAYLHTNAQLSFRRKQLISELNLIYPISQFDGKFSIGGIHLPNSEDFVGNEEVMISVALGFVAHLVQMVSIFLQVPLRYPIHHFSSRSKIIDHVTEKIPEKDREFPLFSRGKDKLQFNYGVYLLNKNIAQLRWLCGLPTQDLRATLPNVTALLHLRPGSNGLDSSRHSLSGSSVDLRSSSQNISPVGSFQSSGLRRHPFGTFPRHSPAGVGRHFERGHRVSKSMGSSELTFPSRIVDDEVRSVEEFAVDGKDLSVSGATVNSLSYSLDKGLDEYEEIKKAEGITGPVSDLKEVHGPHGRLGPGLVGSEPILTPEANGKLDGGSLQGEYSTPKGNEAQKRFLQNWQAGGGSGQACSDDDFEVAHRHSCVFEHVSREQNNDPFCLQSVISNVEEAVLEGSSVEQAMEPLDNSSPTTDILVKPSFSMPHENKIEELFVEPQDLVEHSSNPITSIDSHIDRTPDSSSVVSMTSLVDSDVDTNKFHDRQHIKELDIAEPSSPGCCVVHSTRLLSTNVPDETGLTSLLGDISDDDVFARVASRTEALANHTSSFNLVRPKYGSSLDEGPS